MQMDHFEHMIQGRPIRIHLRSFAVHIDLNWKYLAPELGLQGRVFLRWSQHRKYNLGEEKWNPDKLL